MALYRCGGGSASTLITKNITQNGIYNASDDNADGYSSVNVNVSGGGGVAINTQAQWDALTFAQKKAQGLTVIRNTPTDAIGNWFDLTNASSEYLPYSSNIICDADINNFDATSHSWGNGSAPFSLGNLLTANADGIGVDVNGRNGDTVYCDLGDINRDFTAYIVFRYSSYFAYSAIIGTSYQENAGNCQYVIEDSITGLAQVCGDTIALGNNHAVDTYIVAAIRNNNKTMSFFKNGIKGSDRIANNVGRYVTISTAYPNPSPYCTDITVAYAGVVNESESDSTVLNNIDALMNKFNIS